MKRRWTIKELDTGSTQLLILGLLNERKNELNPLAPLAVEIQKLTRWVEENVPDTRVHDREA